MRAHNFSAGPAALPLSVIEEARAELPVYKDAGASIMEISHRSPEYTAVAASARERLSSLLGIGDEWHILFLHGGASTQFYQVPLNFLSEGGTADYVDTGAWSAKAIKESQRVGTTHVAGTSKADNYTWIPSPATWDRTEGASYLHFTSNNTIHGTELHVDPASDVPLVCDASSDFLSRPYDLSNYGLIYAGAQKNLGPAGVTLVLVKDSFLQRRNSDVPTILDYGTHTAKLFHTPTVFAVYMVEKVLAWIQENGGLEGMRRRNQEKADLLYGRLDRTEFYRGTARDDARSFMNVTFRLPSEELESRFVAEAKGEGLVGLKGHRSVGGIRASTYNAIGIESVKALVDFMDRFEASNG
ncbi:MAG: 3-phosphoserine/phosphohydroxythreonine transaminase [Rhodothermales bacterium]|nr:3-phosphoserine/phosphohydroxythreonine transaminase [Rhodothermales bacterium]MBO6779686.1 3-phosphoserine/phosphohydroxythreonine transaminase [Rhodothermales bacterium]